MYTPYGTPIKDRQKSRDLRNDFVYDKNGLRRFHGAFEGGWSAGYYNTVGSKEGWTPRQWNSNKEGQKATNTVEDYVDDEDDHAGEKHVEIENVGPEILAKWSDTKNTTKNAFEVLPETQKVYLGPGGIGYDSRLVVGGGLKDLEAQNGHNNNKRLTMGSVSTATSMTPGAGKKRPLVLQDEDDEELYPVTKTLPKLRKESGDTGMTKSLVTKHKFLTAKQRRGVANTNSGSGNSGNNSAKVSKPSRTSATCSDGKLPLPNFIVVHLQNPVFKQYGLDSTPVSESALQTQVRNQVDSFLDSLHLSLAANPYKSKLDSKFQLAGSAAQGPKQTAERTVVVDWEPSRLLCKRMGISYDKVRAGEGETKVEKGGGFGREKIEKLRGLFRDQRSVDR